MSLAVAGVTHRYSGRTGPVLRDVSLEVPAGLSVALMGPSGSGKTTLLAILGLLTRPTAGQVLIDGGPVAARSAAGIRAAIFGWIFQGTNVLPHRSALDNAALGLLARGAPARAALATASAALEAVGLGALAHKPANTLSGGELQRVSIARAISVRPRFIFADEPTGQLDAANTEVVIDALIRNRPPQSSILVATHDPDVARRCDRIIRLQDGQVVEAPP